jgi:hypothetical protein
VPATYRPPEADPVAGADLAEHAAELDAHGLDAVAEGELPQRTADGWAGVEPAFGDTYIHTQIAADDSWVIDHGLDKYPSVTIVDSGGTQVEGDVTYPSADRVIVTFTAPFGGKAYLN